MNNAFTVLQSSIHTEGMVAIKKILLDKQERLRKSNDTATGDDILKNQGGLREIKALLKVLTLKEKQESF